MQLVFTSARGSLQEAGVRHVFTVLLLRKEKWNRKPRAESRGLQDLAQVYIVHYIVHAP
jgi:hypothetical protein